MLDSRPFAIGAAISLTLTALLVGLALVVRALRNINLTLMLSLRRDTDI
ncbi:hypothetical protein ACERK3_08895 [Phycisphaerales bacterium AB-hyl4]|uniref:Uncharacterized protein n=1 Tax=Natronomicrosphaera hydrolytica TaxID=3242702 RepID=A0ABV4U487_9BACT